MLVNIFMIHDIILKTIQIFLKLEINRDSVQAQPSCHVDRLSKVKINQETNS